MIRLLFALSLLLPTKLLADCFDIGARCSQFYLNGTCYVIDYNSKIWALNESKTYTCIAGKPPMEAAKTLMAPISPVTIQTFNSVANTKQNFKIAKVKNYEPLRTDSDVIDLAKPVKEKNGEIKILTAQGNTQTGVVKYSSTPVSMGKLESPAPTAANCQHERFKKIDHVYENHTRCEQMFDENYVQTCILPSFCNFKASGCDAETCVRQYYRLKNYNSAQYKKVDELRRQMEKPNDSKTIDYYNICKSENAESNAKTKIAAAATNLVQKPMKTSLSDKYCTAAKDLDDLVLYQVRSTEFSEEARCVKPTIYNFHEDIQYIYQVFEARRLHCNQNETCNGGKCEDATMKAGRSL